MINIRTQQRSLLVISALVYAGSVALTVAWCRSMSDMAAMPMPGGASMSMTWMPGDAWPSAGSQFVGMWVVMMVAMMLPSLVPMLLRYREATRASAVNLAWLTAIVGGGYFFVWTLLGIAAYGTGLGIASIGMQLPELARFVPVTVGLIVLGAGLLQFTPWKLRHLDCCRRAPSCGEVVPAVASRALRHGLRLGFHCSLCCLGQTAVLLVLGVMDLRAMLTVTAAITFERLAPDGKRAAQALGILGVAAGLFINRFILKWP